MICDVAAGQRLKKFRNHLGFTQSQMAEKLDISEEAYRKWEHGQNSLNVARLSLLHEKCGVTPDFLVLGDQESQFEAKLESYINNCEDEEEYNRRVRSITKLIEKLLCRK